MSTEKIAELQGEVRESKSAGIDRTFASKTVKPAQYSLDDKFKFNCHKGIACFNKCCKNVDVPLTPYDILRLKKHLGLRSTEFVARYSLPFDMDAHGIPGLKLTHKHGSSECVFVTEEGCSVYQDRPTACRYYALGITGSHKKHGSKTSNAYFVMNDDFCLGHREPDIQSIRQYLHDQGAAHYDQYNEDWRAIINKTRFSSPAFGKLGERSMQLFDMCSYDIDSFREYIQGSGFLNLFDIDQRSLDILINDDEELLLFAMRFLKQILYSEKTIPLKQKTGHEQLQLIPEVSVKRYEAQPASSHSAKILEDCIDS